MILKKLIFIACLIAIFSIVATAEENVSSDFNNFLKESEQLHLTGKYDILISKLQKRLLIKQSNSEQFEIYWRLSREILRKGDNLVMEDKPKEEIIETYIKGIEFAKKAVSLNPNSVKGFYWQASNIGRLIQTKGIIYGIFEVDKVHDLLIHTINLNPTYSDSFHVLAQLYEKVPETPFTFGNIDYSVSLGRAAVYYHNSEYEQKIIPEILLDFYTELARHLYERNWSKEKRFNEQKVKRQLYKTAKSPFEKGIYFEGAIALKNMSDREEAISMIKWVKQKMANKAIGNGFQRYTKINLQKTISEFGIN